MPQSKKQIALSKKQIALIHVAKSHVGMSEADYRALLGEFGAKSSTALDPARFDEFMRRFKIEGFRKVGTASASAKPPETAALRENSGLAEMARSAFGKSKSKHLKKIGTLLDLCDLPWGYADSMARKMFAIDRIDWCSPDQMRRVVAALEYHRKRKLLVASC